MGRDAAPHRPDLTSALVSAVVEMISRRGIEPGMKIGPLRELAGEFGVAVPTMREALRRLEGLGMLTFRHGSGVYVGPNFHRSVLVNAAPPRPDRHKLVALIQARQLFEPSVAAQAATVRAPHGLELLGVKVAEARRCLTSGDERLWRVNIDIHRAIAVTAGNPIVEEILDAILLIHADEQQQILALHGDPHADHAEHEEIVRLIEAGEADRVRQVVESHLVGVAEVIGTPLTP